MLVVEEHAHDVLLLEARARDVPLAVVEVLALHQLAAQDLHVRHAEDGLDFFKTLIVKVGNDADFVIIATNHDQYKESALKQIIRYAKESCIICDIWNMWGTNKILFNLDDLRIKKSPKPNYYTKKTNGISIPPTTGLDAQI